MFDTLALVLHILESSSVELIQYAFRKTAHVCNDVFFVGRPVVPHLERLLTCTRQRLLHVSWVVVVFK